VGPSRRYDYFDHVRTLALFAMELDRRPAVLQGAASRAVCLLIPRELSTRIPIDL